MVSESKGYRISTQKKDNRFPDQGYIGKIQWIWVEISLQTIQHVVMLDTKLQLQSQSFISKLSFHIIQFRIGKHSHLRGTGK